MEEVTNIDTEITKKLIKIIKLSRINKVNIKFFEFEDNCVSFVVREQPRNIKITILYENLLIGLPIYHINGIFVDDFKNKLNVYLGKVIDKYEKEIPAELCEEIKDGFDFNS